jgi:hypothetical protein
MSMTRMSPLLVLVGLLGASRLYGAAAGSVKIDDRKVIPESITSTAAGDLIIGSSGKGAVYRAKAGSHEATLWLDPAKTGMEAVLGVFADQRSNTLYVCSAPAFFAPSGTQRKNELAALRTFDLTSGAPKGSFAMIDQEKAECGDIDVGADGTAYVTDTGGGQVLRLKKGASALEVWVRDERLAGIDGLALGDHFLFVNTVTTSRLFSIGIGPNGAAGPIVELRPSLKLSQPDGMRSLSANRFLMAENDPKTGRVSEVTVTGDKAELKVLKAEPGVTAITRVGEAVWVNNPKFFTYHENDPKQFESPDPFVIYAIGLK